MDCRVEPGNDTVEPSLAIRLAHARLICIRPRPVIASASQAILLKKQSC